MSNIEVSQAQRLDQRVIEIEPGISRTFAAKLIEQGRVKVNGKVVEKPGYKMREGEVVDVNYDSEELAAIPKIQLPVLYEDDNCVVIEKPVGLLTHSKGAFNPEATVATWLRQRISDPKLVEKDDTALAKANQPITNQRAGIVHRLDRATSGVMICAKTSEALSLLQKQFSQRKAKKSYVAVLQGHLAEDNAVIDMPIERNPKKPQTFRVGANGKAAVTEYKVLKTSPHYSLVELMPQTGRTHQLRVHLQQIGHPIVGDELYGGKSADRLYLHALSLEITIPGSERKVFTSPLPKTFKKVLKENA